MKYKPPHIEELYRCLNCGYCQSNCPIYQEVGWESYTPRGKIYWLKQLSERSFLDKLLGRKIEPNDAWIKSMFTCTTCARCETYCHVDIKFSEY
ncbi:MAG: (Fe-S)-binding protein, partial [Thermoplasmata archaeon]|nr:(Fe-S)-binding protein [Thermoplasmata archaeon]